MSKIYKAKQVQRSRVIKPDKTLLKNLGSNDGKYIKFRKIIIV